MDFECTIVLRDFVEFSHMMVPAHVTKMLIQKTLEVIGCQMVGKGVSDGLIIRGSH